MGMGGGKESPSPTLEVPGEPLEQEIDCGPPHHLLEASCGQGLRASSQTAPGRALAAAEAGNCQGPWLGRLSVGFSIWKLWSHVGKPGTPARLPPPPSSRGTSEAGSLFLCPGASAHVGASLSQSFRSPHQPAWQPGHLPLTLSPKPTRVSAPTCSLAYAFLAPNNN